MVVNAILSQTNDYTKTAAFSCSADGNFFSVSTCWSINIATGRPYVRIDCPDTVLRNKYSNNCSLNKNIIAPEGSSRNNHRQDQSVLTMLMYLYEKSNGINLINNIVRGISFWNKKDNSTILWRILMWRYWFFSNVQNIT